MFFYLLIFIIHSFVIKRYESGQSEEHIKMNPLLLGLYSCIIISTTFLISIIIKYLHEKPSDQQFIRDQIKIDLAVILCSGVCFMSALISLREILGPFQNVQFVELILLFQQVKCFKTSPVPGFLPCRSLHLLYSNHSNS